MSLICAKNHKKFITLVFRDFYRPDGHTERSQKALSNFWSRFSKCWSGLAYFLWFFADTLIPTKIRRETPRSSFCLMFSVGWLKNGPHVLKSAKLWSEIIDSTVSAVSRGISQVVRALIVSCIVIKMFWNEFPGIMISSVQFSINNSLSSCYPWTVRIYTFDFAYRTIGTLR